MDKKKYFNEKRITGWSLVAITAFFAYLLAEFLEGLNLSQSWTTGVGIFFGAVLWLLALFLNDKYDLFGDKEDK